VADVGAAGQVPQTLTKLSNIPATSTPDRWLPSVAERKPVGVDDVPSCSDVRIVPVEPASTCVTRSRRGVVEEPAGPRVGRGGSGEPVDRPGAAGSAREEPGGPRVGRGGSGEPVDRPGAAGSARLCRYVKSLASSSPESDDRQSRRSDSFSPSAGSTEQSAAKRSRGRSEAGRGSALMLRSLDSRQTRAVTGLLTSVMPVTGLLTTVMPGGRLTSANCYKLVRQNKSSLNTDSSQASPSKPLATVSSIDVINVFYVFFRSLFYVF